MNDFKIVKENNFFVIKDANNEIIQIFNSYYEAVVYYEELLSEKKCCSNDNKEINDLFKNLQNKILKVSEEKNTNQYTNQYFNQNYEEGKNLFLEKKINEIENVIYLNNQNTNKKINELAENFNKVLNFIKKEKEVSNYTNDNYTNDKFNNLYEKKSSIFENNFQEKIEKITSSIKMLDKKLDFFEENKDTENIEKNVLDKLSNSLQDIIVKQELTLEKQNKLNENKLSSFENNFKEKLKKIISSIKVLEKKLDFFEENKDTENIEKNVLDKLSNSLQDIIVKQELTLEKQNKLNENKLSSFENNFEEKLEKITSSIEEFDKKINYFEENNNSNIIEIKNILDQLLESQLNENESKDFNIEEEYEMLKTDDTLENFLENINNEYSEN